jgi:xanthine dehydrogenase accessory factor
MNSTDQTILSCLLASLNQGEKPWLVTVVATIGSSPRPVGSLVAFRADGSQVGSVSGGCVEEDLIARLLAGEFNGPQVYLTDYGVSAEDNEKWGLPCGGRLELAIQQLDEKDLEWVTEAYNAMSTRQTLSRSVSLESGETQISPAEQFAPLEKNDDTLTHCFGPRHRLLLVGAGQLAAHLSTLALAMDYEVLLADSREWALDQWQGPEVEKILGLPDDVVREHAADEHCAVITLSHDPRVDDMALMEALGSACWYVGALGSVRTTEKRLQRLSQLGLSREALARLHAPVGLSIGSKTTMEIAVSIMAQLTQLRREPNVLAQSAQTAALGGELMDG